MKKEPMIVAHRGASRDAPENTIPAFMLAWEQGADAIEGDFRQTKDGHIVCIHDNDTQRVADKKLVIERSLLADLCKLDVGAYRGEKYRGTVIPAIAEVFATIPEKKGIYIEIKSDESSVPDLLAEIKRSGLKQEQITIISFNTEVIRATKTQAPQYKALWLSCFKRDKSRRITPSSQTIMETLSRIRADGLSSGKDIVNESTVTSVMEKGYEYHVWTVDDLRTARRFKKWGAMSITTNVPGDMRRNLLVKTAVAGGI